MSRLGGLLSLDPNQEKQSLSKSAGEKYRHELKYVISGGQLAMLQNRMGHLMPIDRHAKQTGGYNIRSLYFDDYWDNGLRENENGTDPREKFRIRIYNHSSDRITLECKRKERGKTHKTSCPLTLEQTKLLMQGKPVANIGEQPPLLRKMTLQMLTRGLRPVVIVEYDRVPYVYKNGNVRVTLDKNIASSTAVMDFLEDQIPKRPVMPLGHQLLEVKYDEYLPDHLYRSLQLSNLRQCAFSKYAICRTYRV